jgi:hypothetical protein
MLLPDISKHSFRTAQKTLRNTFKIQSAVWGDTHLCPDIHTEDGNALCVQNAALKADGT